MLATASVALALAPATAALQRAIERRPAAFPGIVATSTRTGAGIPELRAAIARVQAERDHGGSQRRRGG